MVITIKRFFFSRLHAWKRKAQRMQGKEKERLIVTLRVTMIVILWMTMLVVVFTT